MVDISGPTAGGVRSVGVSQREYQSYLLENIKRYKYRPAAPIHTMMTTPNNLFQTHNTSTPDLIRLIMANIYDYGRKNWTWEATTGGASNKALDPGVQSAIEGMPGGTTGRGLLDGTITGCACGGFAAALKGMALHAFNITMEAANVPGSTAIYDDFITLPGSTMIDSQWKGNVWLDAHTTVDLNQLSNRGIAAFMFSKHYFCNYKGTIYDVTSNTVAARSDDLIWCRLTKADALMPNYPGARTVYTTAVVTPSALIPRKYLINLGKESGIPNGFSNWVMTDRDSIPAEDMRKMGVWTSR